MMRVGFPGYRGMVGSVLMERMQAEDDFARLGIEPVFLSTSQAGEEATINGQTHTLGDAHDLSTLQGLDAIVSCQGSEYTRRVHGELRAKDWNGYWIDASSELRMADSSVLLLDPVNGEQIETALSNGVKDLIGANCTIGLHLMGLVGLFRSGLVEWANPNTMQAVSGAGSKYVLELMKQMRDVTDSVTGGLDLKHPAAVLTGLDRVPEALRSKALETHMFGAPIVANMLPWIDREAGNGQSREEWKAEAEINKILGTSGDQHVTVDGTCTRISAFRSHSQVVHLKLRQDVPLDEVEDMIGSAHEWVKIVPNTREATLERLTPVAVSGTLDVAVGRLRKLSIGPQHLNVVVVGDQLLWGAAEPLRRALAMVTRL